MQLFRERLLEKVHATIPKGIVGGFEFAVLHRNLKEWHERPWTYVCDKSYKRSFDSYSTRNGVLIISHITFRDCRVHSFADNLSRSSGITSEKPILKQQVKHLNLSLSLKLSSYLCCFIFSIHCNSVTFSFH